KGHAVPALGEYASGLEPGRASADDEATLRPGGPDDPLGQHQLTSGRRVVDADRGARRVDAVEADTRADARPDAVGVAGRDLRREIRVGHERPGHADEVDQARGDGV